jgi:hypothetical protein
MSLSPGQAAENLREIARTERRSAEAHEYANASPGFILWGLLWVVGYTGSYLLPHYGFIRGINWLWCGLTVGGVVGSTIIGRNQHRAQHPGQRAAGRAMGLRWIMTLVAMWIFTAATFTVLRPVNAMSTGAFIPLLVALAYAVFGIWRGSRFLYAGIVLAALTLGGWFLLPQYFLPWMAAVGGGSLILVGLWLKRV